MKYQTKIALENRNNSHTLAFEKIQKFSGGRSLLILEVGCSSGYFGAELMRHGHQVWGVEPYVVAAKEAEKVLTCVHAGSIENFFDAHEDARFDVIVFGDVLEHLAEPAHVLKICKNFLLKNGCIVASVPNVAHMAIRAMMLEGRWEYSDLGILDRTHLRFFTRTSLIGLFSDAGYTVSNIDPGRISAEQANEICKLNLSKESIAAATVFAKDLNAYDFQYVVTALPGVDGLDCHAANDKNFNEDSLRVVCLVHVTDSTLVDIRLRNPLLRWAALYGGSVRFVSIFEHNFFDLEWGDVFIFQRASSEYAVSLIRQLKSAGKKVVFEIDDLLFDLPPFMAHHQESMKKNRKFMLQAISAADIVSVSTPELATQIVRHNQKRVVTPNYSEPMQLQSEQFEVAPDQLVLIIASSDKVKVEFIVEALNMIQAEFDVLVIGIGPPSVMLAESGVVIRHFENLPHEKFKALVASFSNAIGIIPLDDSLFSSCKSAVKYFDYAVAGIPSICSKVLPYKAVITSGENGILVANTTQAWYAAIKELILSAEKRKTISANAQQYVEKNCSLDATAYAWSVLFDQLNVQIAKRHLLKIGQPGVQLQFIKTIQWAMPHLLKPDSYAKAYSTYKKYGMSGLLRRVKRI